jgi:excisionase family DNA binding protein
MSETKQTKLLYTVTEAAEMLSVSPWTVRWLIRVGKLKARRIGDTCKGRLRFTLADLEAFIEGAEDTRRSA